MRWAQHLLKMVHVSVTGSVNGGHVAEASIPPSARADLVRFLVFAVAFCVKKTPREFAALKSGSRKTPKGFSRFVLVF